MSRLGVRVARPDLRTLGELYRAWGSAFGMENLSKRLAMLEADDPLDTALTPEATCTRHLQLGTSGTCWTSMEAFVALAKAAGFDARPRTGEMRGPGEINHGAVVVVLDGVEYSCDQNLLWPAPLPLRRDAPTRVDGPHYSVEAIPDPARPAWRIRRFTAKVELRPTVLLDVEVRREDYFPWWRRSFVQSVFNQGYFVNRIREGVWRQLDTARYQELSAGATEPVVAPSPGPDALAGFVEARFGISAWVIERLRWLEAQRTVG